ncbi:A/G-specific adenine glycosylase [Niabella hibiscisoli]|uniref:A/G-specific adenine glycosylase n=1 Tax=Niabella hibiscisoli TaxID=1825928 RepID=UPI001F10E48A|nr:A/G-specific adenine glycosylase [Niabella hibiscisoli]MCH5715291.1 A/G-specific adenine glycosylase [Niabella hibiscisoli]
MSNLTHNNLEVSNFSKLLLKWHKTDNDRQLPWKGEKDAYKIWLSEIILQQTRVEQGLEYYHNFILNFPTIKDLAAADEKRVFKLWEGLGYYSRCRNLIATARIITEEYNGIFPSSYYDILKLKGVGPYTASAIASFAFNLPHAVVDGNVYRVLARVFGIGEAIDSTAGKKNFHQLANELLDRKQPGKYNQAIMDFGATVCKPAVPLCDCCTFQKYCEAYADNRVQQLPVKEKKIKQRARYFYFFIIQCGSKVAIRERQDKDIWQHLHEFPLIELVQDAHVDAAIEEALNRKWITEDAIVKQESAVYRQKLTHQSITAVFINTRVKKLPASLKNYDWIETNDLAAHSFPKIINDYLNSEELLQEETH